MSQPLDIPLPFEQRRLVRIIGGLLLAVVVVAMFGLKGSRAALYLMPLAVAVFLLGRPRRPARRLDVQGGDLLVWPADGTGPDRFALGRLELVWRGDWLLAHDGGVPVRLAQGRHGRTVEAWLRARVQLPSTVSSSRPSSEKV